VRLSKHKQRVHGEVKRYAGYSSDTKEWISICFHGAVFQKGKREILKWRFGDLSYRSTTPQWEVFYQCSHCRKTNMMSSNEAFFIREMKKFGVGQIFCTICCHCGENFTTYLIGYSVELDKANKKRMFT